MGLVQSIEDLQEELVEKNEIQKLNEELQRQIAELMAANEELQTQNSHLEQEKLQSEELRGTLKDFAQQFQNNQSKEHGSPEAVTDFVSTLDKFAETQRELQQQLY